MVRIRGLGPLGALKQTLRRTSADNDTKHGAEREADRALQILQAQPTCAGACKIGWVSEQHAPKVLLKSTIGAQRILDMPTGEQLPRIC